MKMTVFMTNNIFVVNSIMLSSKFLFSGLVVGIFLVYLKIIDRIMIMQFQWLLLVWNLVGLA